jgi:hypothetical protein
MKIKPIAATAAALLFASQAFLVFADDYNYGYGGYDYNYGYGYSTDTDTTTDYSYDYNDYGYGYGYGYSYDDSTADTDSSGDTYAYGTYDSSSTDSEQTTPSEITLEIGEIKDLKFTAKLKIESTSPITAADITISYDPEVIKINSGTINENAGGTAAGSVISDGTYQYVYANSGGSEFEDEYLTLNAEIIDTTVRSSVMYLTVNSLLDMSAKEIGCVSDGSIINIGTAVPTDVSTDESMYSELHVTYSEDVVDYETLGLSDVSTVTLEDGELATADDSGITTLSDGITNMTVEFSDGTFQYYRLVISMPETDSETSVDSVDSAEQTAADTSAVSTSKKSDKTDKSAKTAKTDKSKKSDSKSNGVKKAIIIVAAVAALAAIVVEYFVIVGNPFESVLQALEKYKSENNSEKKEEDYEDDDFFPERSDESNEDDDEDDN